METEIEKSDEPKMMGFFTSIKNCYKNYFFFEVSFSLLLLFALMALISCKRVEFDNEEAVISEALELAAKIPAENVIKITLPDDLPKGVVLTFEVPPIPDHEVPSFPFLTAPTDVKDIVKKMKPARKYHQHEVNGEGGVLDYWYEYDDQDRVIHTWQEASSYEGWTLYTENGSRYIDTNGYYWEADSKNRLTYQLSPAQESWHEYTDYDGYYTGFNWDFTETSSSKCWNKKGGDKSYWYRETIEEGKAPYKEWHFSQQNDDFDLFCNHTVYSDSYTHPELPPKLEERFTVYYTEKNSDKPHLSWEWDNSGHCTKRLDKSNGRYKNTITYAYNNSEVCTGVNGYESGAAGDYSFWHEWHGSAPAEGQKIKSDNLSISVKEKSILETFRNNEDDSSGVTIYDPETGRSYSVSSYPNELWYVLEKNGKTQQMYHTVYDNETNTSSHYKRKDYEDEWKRLFPKEEYDFEPVDSSKAKPQEQTAAADADEDVPVITVPNDLPDGVVLSFDVPPIPEHEVHQFPLPPVPTDVKDIVQKIKPARKTHEYNEGCKRDEWKEYDDQDRLIHERHSGGFERWTQYTENGSRVLSSYGPSGFSYTENDSKNRDVYYLNPVQEWWNEYTDYDGYYTGFTWNHYKIGSGDDAEFRTYKGWSKREGDKSYCYSESEERGIPIKNWEFYQNNDDIIFSCSHYIKYNPRLCPPNPYLETFSVSLHEKKSGNAYTLWEWDNSGYCCKTVGNSKEGYVNTLHYYSRKEHEGKSGHESGSEGDYSFYRNWSVPEPYAKYGTKTNSLNILEKGKEIVEFSLLKDKQKADTTININDPETGRLYSVYMEPTYLRYCCQKNGKVLKMYSVGYDNESNTSVHCKQKDIDDWEQIFPSEDKK